jgi:hypothetical protein
MNDLTDDADSAICFDETPVPGVGGVGLLIVDHGFTET